MFNTQEALSYTRHAFQVINSKDQSRLNIENRTRTSVLPWRGQFSPQLVEYLLQKYAISKDTVLDPFCGSGTVIYEGASLGCNIIACDINPAAIALAQAANICIYQTHERLKIIEEVAWLSLKLYEALSKNDKGFISTTLASKIFSENIANLNMSCITIAFLMIIFGNSSKAEAKHIRRAFNMIKKLITFAPYHNGTISLQIGDARQLNVKSNSIDYIITSPPYINVFNYHQNYRPIMEALGNTPLTSAKAEIGANRKFRMNRYITVVQYCMDIALFFKEATRVLKHGCLITIVLGRESNVRGVSFKNGELVAAIALKGINGKIVEWNERRFMNRFGIEIYEDILTIEPNFNNKYDHCEIGRSIGLEALKSALAYAPNERVGEIEQAIKIGQTVAISPYILGDN